MNITKKYYTLYTGFCVTGNLRWMVMQLTKIRNQYKLTDIHKQENDIKNNTIPKWFERLKEKKSQHKKQKWQRESKESKTSHT